ncbi:hypothetical protein ACOSP6_00355 [Tenacibaculum sp. MEBiC06402]|uniref:hypothetical protein n=1 Tax=unclassified Tenacibaculum TaxID=2635139 RepID=UPI003B9BEAE7
MSIIIANINNKECFFFSDTKVTLPSADPTVFGEQKLRLAPEEGSLKVHILQRRICIAFAGTVEICEQIIQSLFREKPDRIPEYLQANLIRENDDSEFILALVDKEHNPRLFHIDQKKCEEGISFWIGSQKAFSEFQSFFVESSINNLMEKTNWSFKKMIENTNEPIIGDFIIGAHFVERYSSFIYQDSLSYSGSLKTIKISEHMSTQIGNETNEDGAFIVANLISDQVYKPAICLYFELGDVAFLYFPISENKKETRPKVIRIENRKELQDYVKEHYDLNLIGFTNEQGRINYK